MTDQKKAPGMAGRARYDSIIELNIRQYTIDSALRLALNDLFGRGVVLQGRGQWQRFAPPGKRDLDGYVAILSYDVAIVGRWDTDERYLVVLGDDNLNEAERRQRRAQSHERARRARHEQQARRQQEQALAAERARKLWARAAPAQDHPYLLRKRVAPGWARQLGHLLQIPLTDGVRLVNLQTIDSDGTKRFLTNARKKGCYHPIGTFDNDAPLLLCEGWATGMTLHTATGYPVACAMDKDNLLPVARYLRDCYPGVSIIACCDNDHHQIGNPGIAAGKAAAAAVGGRAIWPDVDGIKGASDYNDLARLGGEVVA